MLTAKLDNATFFLRQQTQPCTCRCRQQLAADCRHPRNGKPGWLRYHSGCANPAAYTHETLHRSALAPRRRPVLPLPASHLPLHRAALRGMQALHRAHKCAQRLCVLPSLPRTPCHAISPMMAASRLQVESVQHFEQASCLLDMAQGCSSCSIMAVPTSQQACTKY